MSTKKKLPANRLPNADEYQLKAALIVQLKRLMAEREITQDRSREARRREAAQHLQAASRAVQVGFRGKLLRMLAAFDQDVEIKVKPHRKRGEGGRITFIRA
ncbi:XRE family transcriptional regulator [Bradyrhizobium sp. WSM471]|uniref:XRE family transcriptional regulator n=1 Tax=Bradyrhizobium sp. WSM471 TaxID=319017 RepID=UPI003133BBAA